MEFSDEPAALPVTHLPGISGHIVVAEGEDHTGEPAVAVWHASATGVPVGAWIKPISLLASDPSAADQLLQLTRRRALFGWDVATESRLLASLASWAGREPLPLPVTVLLPDILTEVADHRLTYETAVEAHHNRLGTKLNPLVWRRDIPAVDSWAEFVQAARVRMPTADCSAAGKSLHLIRAVAWAAELWHQTETTRTRRKYLAERFGPATTLPPRWVDQLRSARTTIEGV